MDNVTNRPTTVNQRPGYPNQVAHKPTGNSGNGTSGVRQKAPKSRKKMILTAVVIAVIAALLIAGAWFFSSRSSTSSTISSDKYQAVFFTNGQVYFGKLKALNGDYMRLTDIYYLQAKSSDAEKSNPQEASAQDASNVQLVKLGSEIHGPDDEMVVNKDQILFFENLKKDSNVSTTIANYQSQQKNK